MGKSVSVVVVSVVAALAIAWLWFPSNEATTSSPPQGNSHEPDVRATETAGVVPSAASVEDTAAGSQASPVATQDERAVNGAKKISDAFERGVAPTFVDYLVSKGASHEDSERIVADAMREVASCVLDAVRAEPSAELAPLEVTAGNPPMRFSGVFFSDRVRSCMESVNQRIGLPPKVMYGMNAQGGTVEFSATVLPE
jgi:hypothetical protein